MIIYFNCNIYNDCLFILIVTFTTIVYLIESLPSPLPVDRPRSATFPVCFEDDRHLREPWNKTFSFKKKTKKTLKLFVPTFLKFFDSKFVFQKCFIECVQHSTSKFNLKYVVNSISFSFLLFYKLMHWKQFSWKLNYLFLFRDITILYR